MIYKVHTKTNITTIQDEIEEKAKAHGFGVLKCYPFQEMLEKKGQPIDKAIFVYELCDPVGGKKVLTENPEISAFLPCRISVYQEGEHTILATISVESILTGLTLSKELNDYMTNLFETFKKILHSWDD
ncbi:MAG: DUF302 domain-containing protein [Sulfurovum sp.]|nr:DUF302 domain-containing protein [Sulfurovum sp.]